MTRSVSRRRWREINGVIYRGLVLYLSGPKFDGGYIIDGGRARSGSNVVRVHGSRYMPSCSIYFDFRIRIGVSWRRFDVNFSDFYEFQGETCAIPEPDDVDEYVRRVVAFLREFLLHASRVRSTPEQYSRMAVHPDGYICGGLIDGVNDACPDALRSALTCHESILMSRYVVDDVDSVVYLTNLMRGKAFRRSRGDYSSK